VAFHTLTYHNLKEIAVLPMIAVSIIYLWGNNYLGMYSIEERHPILPTGKEYLFPLFCSVKNHFCNSN
jgi:hypothetical protein